MPSQCSLHVIDLGGEGRAGGGRLGGVEFCMLVLENQSEEEAAVFL